MTTRMASAVISPIAKIFAINDDLAVRALDGLTDAQLWSAPTRRNNPMMWVVGHFVQTRAQLLALLGEPIDTGWQERFVRGATLGDATQYPSRDEVERIMNDVSRRLTSFMIRATSSRDGYCVASPRVAPRTNRSCHPVSTSSPRSAKSWARV